MRLRSDHLNTTAFVITTSAATSLLLACGWGIAGGHAKTLFVAAAIAGLVALALTKRGACLGALLLAAMNGLPFVDTSLVVAAKMTVGDLAVIALLLVASTWILLDKGTAPRNRAARAISHVGGLVLLWWMLTIARTVISQHVPLLHATAFGRDFLYFGLLLVVLPRVRLTTRDIGALLGVLLLGACLFAAGQIMTVTGLTAPNGLIHFERAAQQSGLTRVYAHMTDLVTAGVAVGVGASLAARRPIVRLVAAPASLLLITSVVLQLTRARWIGLVVGIVSVSLWLLMKGGARVAPAMRRRLAFALGALAIAGVAALLATPSVASGGTLMERLLSIVTDLQTGSGTVAVREEVTRSMVRALGGQWPYGLGFVPPSAHYFLGLPSGSIRNSDLGVLNVVMTMGAIGAFVLYLPFVLGLIQCLQRSPARWSNEYSWLRYGGAVWIVATLVSSVTLVTLFSTSGLALAAVAMTVLVHPSVSGAPAQVAVSDAQPRTSVALGRNGWQRIDQRPGVGLTVGS